jgi:hypothetical protein
MIGSTMRLGRRGVLAAGVSLIVLWGASPALAETAPAPGFTVSVYAAPAIFSTEKFERGPVAGLEGNGGDYYLVTVRNSGSKPTDGSAITIVDTLPAGLEAGGVSSAAHGGPLPCGGSGTAVICTFSHVLKPGEVLRIQVPVSVALGMRGSVTSTVTVSGGGVSTVSAAQSTTVGTAAESLAVPFGFENFTDQVTGMDGSTDTQAGDHPYETTVSFMANTAYVPGASASFFNATGLSVLGGLTAERGAIKDFVVDLPPGFVGNPQVVPKCPGYKVGDPISEAESNNPEEKAGSSALNCPLSTQVGVVTIYLNPTSTQEALSREEPFQIALSRVETVPIYNIEPDKGYPAEFAFEAGGKPITLFVSVNEETNYGVRVIVPDIPAFGSVVGASATFFGTPATDGNANNQNPLAGLSSSGFGIGSLEPVPFLQNPVDCAGGPQVAKVSMDTWQHPGAWPAGGQPDLGGPNWAHATTTAFPSITGCNLLQFNPGIEVLPDTSQADEPSGLAVHLRVPQAQQRELLAVTPELKDATVTLPQGVSVSPSAADGLAGCSDGQFGLESPSRGGCPLASVLGSVQIFTPLLPGPLEGHVFLGVPHCDPCSSADASDGNMFRIFLEAEGSGVVIKKVGTIYANPSTGQLTTVFTNNPQLPFSDLELHFKSGLRAPLAMPQSCGTFATTSDLVPWSSPVTADANPSSQFSVDWDGHGGACPSVLPFGPYFSAGTSNANAGQFSPLTVTFGREDREQDLAAIAVRTPPGLLGTLTGLPLCGEPQASLGTCSDASRIGSMTVAAGPGGHPFYEKGALYLTGPYKGAPFGLSIVVPTVAGPFNLGNVVVRATVNVDSHTAALTVTSDAFPQVIDGIPLRLRTANVTVDRPGFIFNPTNCAQLHVEATITGAQGAVSNVSAPFAVAGCHGLSFAPKFSVYTSGRTSRVNGASLDAKLNYPSGPQSNISKVKVELPRALPSRLTTLQKACPAATFDANPASCPAASVVGVAKAVTPVLPTPLTGPAYFVSHGGEAFPNLVVILQGYGVRIDLVGDTFISKAGITSSTFTNVPDVQVSSFELYLPEGPDSALAANGNLCKQQLVMPATFTGQDGAQLKENVKLKVTGCAAKAAKARKARRARNARRAARARRAGYRNSGHGGGR